MSLLPSPSMLHVSSIFRCPEKYSLNYFSLFMLRGVRFLEPLLLVSLRVHRLHACCVQHSADTLPSSSIAARCHSLPLRCPTAAPLSLPHCLIAGTVSFLLQPFLFCLAAFWVFGTTWKWCVRFSFLLHKSEDHVLLAMRRLIVVLCDCCLQLYMHLPCGIHVHFIERLATPTLPITYVYSLPALPAWEVVTNVCLRALLCLAMCHILVWGKAENRPACLTPQKNRVLVIFLGGRRAIGGVYVMKGRREEEQLIKNEWMWVVNKKKMKLNLLKKQWQTRIMRKQRQNTNMTKKNWWKIDRSQSGSEMSLMFVFFGCFKFFVCCLVFYCQQINFFVEFVFYLNQHIIRMFLFCSIFILSAIPFLHLGSSIFVEFIVQICCCCRSLNCYYCRFVWLNCYFVVVVVVVIARCFCYSCCYVFSC